MILTNREKRFIREAFGRYLSPALVERLSDTPAALTLGGEQREITVLFSDIRGFTGLSENLDPGELTGLLNALLTPMTDVLLAREATIDKYIGDAIMAFWNAPLDIDDHPRKACLAALDMVAALERLNGGRNVPLHMGIGLHTGPACVGNMGSEQRFSYSAIGDSVNLAARVEGLTKQYGLPILVTDATRSAADDLAFLEADRVRVVGRNAPVTLHALVGNAAMAATARFECLRQRHEAMLCAYRNGEFAAAREAASELRALGLLHLDGLYALYQERCQSLTDQPPGAHWDGVFEAQAK